MDELTPAEWVEKANSEVGLTEDELQYWENWISQAPQIEMSKMHRFAPVGHPLFCTRYENRLHKTFIRNWAGMTPAQSKKIGW